MRSMCFPPYADNPIRVEFWGDEIEVSEIDNVTGEVLNTFEALPVWPLPSLLLRVLRWSARLRLHSG